MSFGVAQIVRHGVPDLPNWRCLERAAGLPPLDLRLFAKLWLGPSSLLKNAFVAFFNRAKFAASCSRLAKSRLNSRDFVIPSM